MSCYCKDSGKLFKLPLYICHTAFGRPKSPVHEKQRFLPVIGHTVLRKGECHFWTSSSTTTLSDVENSFWWNTSLAVCRKDKKTLEKCMPWTHFLINVNTATWYGRIESKRIWQLSNLRCRFVCGRIMVFEDVLDSRNDKYTWAIEQISRHPSWTCASTWSFSAG